MPTSAPRRTEARRKQRRRASALGLALAVSACTPAATTRVALQGDLPSLKAAISEAERQDRLDRGEVRRLARAVLHRELSAERAPNEEFPSLQPCVESIRSVLEDVAAGPSGFAASASVALIDAGFEPPRAQAAGDSERVVVARQARGAMAGPRRRALMLHGDAEVRRAALLASLDSAEPADVESLIEAARLDPDAQARSLAVRALGRIGGRRAVLALRDLWAVASPEQRRDIVLAWARPASFRAGGERELISAVEAASGEPSVLAALVLDSEQAGPPGLAKAALLRSIASTRKPERLLALEAASWKDAELQAAISAARTHADPATRIIALLRRVENDAIDPEGTGELRALSTAPEANVALAARAVLARAGDSSVVSALRADLQAERAEQRALAALALAELGEWALAAPALADDSPAVRRRVACQMLADSEPRDAHGPSRPPLFGSLAPKLVSLLSPNSAS